MRNILDPESPVLQFITKLVYSVWLNILWFVCCIPIITIGPATTALFYCCQKMALDEEGHITRAFFHSFRVNFKQGAVIGLIMTISGAVLVFDGFVLLRLSKTSAFWAILTAVFIVACVAWLIVFMWVFPLLAHFDNTTAAMFKNAIMLGMRFLLCTAFMAAIYIIMALLIIHVMTPLIIFGMGTCAFLNSIILKNVLIQCEGKSGEAEENPSDGTQAEGMLSEEVLLNAGLSEQSLQNMNLPEIAPKDEHFPEKDPKDEHLPENEEAPAQ